MVDQNVTELTNIGTLPDAAEFYVYSGGADAAVLASVMQTKFASQAAIYAAVKAIVLGGTNVTVTPADGASTLTLSASGGGGGGLNQSAVDARIAALVENWAEVANGTTVIPTSKLHSDVVLSSELRSAVYTQLVAGALTAGTGITLTPDADANTYTIASTGGGSQGAKGDTGPAGPAGGYAYYQHTEMTFTAVTSAESISANGSFEQTLLSETYPGPIFADVPFSAEYEGFVYLDVNTTANYDITLEFTHVIGDVTLVAKRTVHERIRGSELYTLPLGLFDSVSTVQVGSFTDADGTTIEITEAMLEEDTEFTIKLIVARTNNAGFTVNSASADSASGTFSQQAVSTPAVAGMSLTEIGSDSVTTAWAQIDAITRADVADLFLVHAEYTRTNTDLNMSGIVLKSDIPDDPSEYKFQVQGAGGDYVGLRFSAAGDAAELQASEGGSPTDVELTIYNIAAAEAGGGGTTFTPSKTNIYAAVKEILQGGTNVTITPDDTDSELDITASGGGSATTLADATLADTSAGSGGSASTGARSDHAHRSSGIYAQVSHGTHVTFGNAPGADQAAAAVGSASTVARSDHRHGRSGIYASSTHNHSNSISRIPTASPGNNKFWGTNGSGTDAWYDQSSLGGGSTSTFIKPSTSQDQTSSNLPAQTVFNSFANLTAARDNISSPSDGDISWGFYWGGGRVNSRMWGYNNSDWKLLSSRSEDPAGFIGQDNAAPYSGHILPFTINQEFPQWSFVYSGPSLYQKQTDTSALELDAQPNLGDQQAWEKIWPRDIPPLVRPSYQGNTDWLTPHVHFPRRISMSLLDIAEAYNGQSVAVEIEADLPEAQIANVELQISKASGGAVSDLQTVRDGKHFYLLDIVYETVPDLNIGPIVVEMNSRVDGTYRVRILSAYLLNGGMDAESWRMYKLNLDTLEDRAVALEDQNPYKGQWGNRVQYHIGDTVRNGSHPTLYVRLTDMPDPPTEDQRGPRGDRTNWVPISEWMGTWEPGMYLSPGNVVNRTVNTEYRLYMVIAELSLYYTEPENSEYFMRIDRENLDWDELENVPGLQSAPYANERQGIAIVGASTGPDDVHHVALLRRAVTDSGAGVPMDGVVTGHERDKLQRLLHTYTPPDIANELETLTGEDRLDYEALKNKPSTGEHNVQADWGETDTSSDAFIRRKPTLAPSNAERNVQSNWDETNQLSDAYILNKPTTDDIISDIESETGDDRLDYEALKNKPTINSGDVNVNADLTVTDSESDSYVRGKSMSIRASGTRQYVALANEQTLSRMARILLANESGSTDGFVTAAERLKLQGLPADAEAMVRAIEALTGDARLDAVAIDNLNRWAQAGRTPLKSEWTVGRQYYAGEMSGYFSHVYTANEDHLATADNGPRGANSVWTSRLELRVETAVGPILGSVTSPSSPDDLQTLSLDGWMFWRGAYNSGYSYHKQNVVSHNNKVWIATREVPGGNAPSSSSSYWSLLFEAPASTGSSVSVTNYTLPFSYNDIGTSDPSEFWHRTTISTGTWPVDSEVTCHWDHQYSQTPLLPVFWAGDPSRSVETAYFQEEDIGMGIIHPRAVARDSSVITAAPAGSIHSLPISRPIVGSNIQDVTHVTDNVLFAIGDDGNLCFWTSDQRPRVGDERYRATGLKVQVKVY